jgi:hypothetical protein
MRGLINLESGLDRGCSDRNQLQEKKRYPGEKHTWARIELSYVRSYTDRVVCLNSYLPVLLSLTLNTGLKAIAISRLFSQRVNADRVCRPLLALMLLSRQDLDRCTAMTLQALCSATLRMLELVGETVIVEMLLCNPDLIADEDCCKTLLNNRPEYWHRGTDDGETDLYAGKNDRRRCPPGEIDVGICPSLVVGYRVETPNRRGNNSGVDQYKSQVV